MQNTRGRCKKATGGARSYFKAGDAIKRAKEIYDEQGVKVYFYRCQDFPCFEFGIFHLTKNPPQGRWKVLNKSIINYHLEKERFGKGKKRTRRKVGPYYDAYRARATARRRFSISAWENEGGALHPRDLED